MPETKIVWFRNDLRVHDHEPLAYAADTAGTVLPVYCFDPRHFRTVDPWGFDKTGPYRARFLRESVADLRGSLQDLGADLIVRHGKPEDVLPDLVRAHSAVEVCCYEKVGTEESDAETAVERQLERTGARPAYFWGKTLYHIDDIPFDQHEVPDVYTPFRKGVEKKAEVRAPVQSPNNLPPLPDDVDAGTIPSQADLGFDHDGAPDDRAVLSFQGGETRALDRLDEYIWREDQLKKYKKTRNGLLGANFSSKFSAWLAHGCLSPRRIHEEVKRYERKRVSNKSTYWMLFELIWRDFFTFIGWKYGSSLFHTTGPMDKDVTWRADDEAFRRWANGTTGIPFVDANMRELNRSGYMSNRGRQNVASMLAKSLKLDWRMGGAYFEAKLVDYDVTSNWGNWAYNAGVGNDPRDRYFNIVKQANRYDGNGDYVRHWLPELEDVPDDKVHEPHTMTPAEQEAAGCIIGEDYPAPIVNLEETYQRIRSEG